VSDCSRFACPKRQRPFWVECGHNGPAASASERGVQGQDGMEVSLLGYGVLVVVLLGAPGWAQAGTRRTVHCSAYRCVEAAHERACVAGAVDRAAGRSS